jgi:GNAT superfamily N-acetyltransferase
LIDELRAYGLALEQGMMIVEQAGERIGCFGFLYEPKGQREGAGATAFLIGPLLACAGHDLMNDVLKIAERDAAGRGLQELRICIAPANRGLLDTFTRRNWTLAGRSLEMKLECGHETPPVAADPAVRPLQSGSAHIDEAAKLLADAFGWDADGGRRLQGCLDDGYHVAYVAQEGELAAVAIWYGVAPFARIENIVVRADRRRCGLGSMLVRAAVASLQSMGRQTVFLALDPDNTAARNLYRRHGFVETTASAIYGFDLRS